MKSFLSKISSAFTSLKWGSNANNSDTSIDLSKELTDINNQARNFIKEEELEDDTKQLLKIPSFDISNIDYSKLVVLFMDDNESITFFMEEDLKYFNRLSKALKSGDTLNINDSNLVSLLEENGLKEFLISEFSIDKISFISFSSDYAVFSLRNLLPQILRVDISFLDLIYGGSISEAGNRVILDGIDAAEMLDSKFPKCHLKFYSGSDLGKHSPEVSRFNSIRGTYLLDELNPKSSQLNDRRVFMLKALRGAWVNVS